MKSGPGLAPRPIIRIVTQNSFPALPSRKGTVAQLDVPGGLFECEKHFPSKVKLGMGTARAAGLTETRVTVNNLIVGEDGISRRPTPARGKHAIARVVFESERGCNVLTVDRLCAGISSNHQRKQQ
jgi:hypothetical protein